MTSKKEKIVIVGYGWVGQANAVALRAMGCPVFYYDVHVPPRYYGDFDKYYEGIKKLNNPLDEESDDTFYLVCVGDKVSPEGEQDISFIEKALVSIKKAKGRIILRSTVLPQYLSKLDFDYYLPEFLHEKKGVEECLRPYYFVVGARGSIKNMPNFLTEWKQNAHRTFEGTVEQASYIKYLSNIWNALRIAFVNELGDVMVDSGLVSAREAQKALDFLFENKIYLRYGRAFSGHCLPKDSLAFARAHSQNQAPYILKAIPLSNDFHQKLESRLDSLVEWSSPWEYQSYVSDSTDAVRFLLKRLLTSRHTTGIKKIARPVVNPIINKIWGKNNLLDVKKTWDKLARENALYFVNIGTPSGRRVSDLELRETGRFDYEKNIISDECLKDYIKDPKMATVLEIGVGVARMTEHIARDFGQVCGVEISDEMAKIAKERLGGVANVVISTNNGRSIPFPDSNFDFIFSQSVFRYLPNSETAASYLEEIKRTLKPGGIAKIQFRTGGSPRKWQWFYGVSFVPEEISSLAQSAGLRIVKQYVDGARNIWTWFIK